MDLQEELNRRLSSARHRLKEMSFKAVVGPGTHTPTAFVIHVRIAPSTLENEVKVREALSDVDAEVVITAL